MGKFRLAWLDVFCLLLIGKARSLSEAAGAGLTLSYGGGRGCNQEGALERTLQS